MSSKNFICRLIVINSLLIVFILLRSSLFVSCYVHDILIFVGCFNSFFQPSLPYRKVYITQQSSSDPELLEINLYTEALGNYLFTCGHGPVVLLLIQVK